MTKTKLFFMTMVLAMLSFSTAWADNVAKIGTTEYATLQDAISAATEGQTVTLVADVSLTNRLFINAGATPAYAGTGNRYATTSENKSITLDMNGHNITSSSNIALAGGSLNIINNGTADATHGVISTSEDGLAPVEVRGTGDLTQKRTLTIGTGVTLKGSTYGLNVFGSNDAQKNIIDVNVNGKVNGTIFVLGNLKNTENEININVAGTVAGPTNDNDKADVGIALNGYAAVTVENGAQVSGETGIEVRAGELIVNGGTITATASTYSEKKNGSGSSTKGAAIAVAQHTTKLPITTTLNGGTLNGTKTLVVTDVEEIGLNSVAVVATQSYTQNAVLPEGYTWKQNGDKYYLEATSVAQIGDTKYGTLAEAFAEATDGDAITLLADATLTDRLFVNAGATPAYAGTGNRYATTSENKSITLDMNGHNITSSSNIALAGGSLNIINNGTADATHGVISTSEDGLAPVEVRGTGDLTQKRTLTIGTGVTLKGSTYGLNVFGSNDAQKNIIDVNVNGKVNGTIFVLGNLKNTENEININVAGTVAGPTNDNDKADVGIALNGNAKVTVADGAYISGETGIEVRAGELVVNGGTIKATCDTYSYTANNSGSATKGAAIAVAQHSTVLPIATTLNGGTLEGGENTIAVVDAQGNALENVVVTATKSFTSNAIVPNGFEWVDNNDNTWTLRQIEKINPYEAEITIGTGGMSTFCSTDNVDFTPWWVNNGVKAYIATGVEPINGVIKMTRVNSVKAGIGVLLIGNEGDKLNVYTLVSGYELIGNNLLKPVFTTKKIQQTEVIEGTEYTNFYLTTKNNATGFYKVSSNGLTPKLGLAYLQLPTEWLDQFPSQSHGIGIMFDDEGTNGIENLQSNDAQSTIYDISGRKMDSNSLPKGIYITNGKKVVVK